MRELVHNHPHMTQFLVLVGVVIACIPAWGGVWYAIAYAGQVMIVEGCRAEGYSCYYEGNTIVIATLVLLPFFFYLFIFVANKLSGLVTDRVLRWAGLDPKVALL